jgi:hypothetical protein
MDVSRAQTRVLVFGALILVTLFLSLRDFYSYQFGYTPDSVEYTLLAHSLIAGPTFALDYVPGPPAPTHYPFGFPLLLVPFVLVAPNDFVLPQWLSLAATLLSGSILFWGWRTLVPMYSDRWRYVICAMFLLAPLTIGHTRLILSEAPFTAFVLLCLWFAALLLKTPRRHSLWVGFAIAFFFMVFTRSIGWVIGAGILVYLAIALRRALVRGGLVALTMALVLLAGVMAVTPVTIGNLFPAQYLEWFVGLGPINPETRETLMLRRAGQPTPAPTPASLPETDDITSSESQNALRVDTGPIEAHIHADLRKLFFLTGGGTFEPVLAQRLNAPWLLLVPGFVALLLLFVGNLRWVRDTFVYGRKPISLFQFSALGYLLIVFLWRGGGERLFYPVQAQMYLALLLAVLTVIQLVLRLGGRLHRALREERATQFAAVALGAFVVAWLMLAVIRDLTLHTSYESSGDLNPRSEAILAYTPPDAILLSDWASLDYLMTGRRGVYFPLQMNTRLKLSETLRRNQITHVILAFDDTFSVDGVAPGGRRVQFARAALGEMVANGELVRVYSSPLPIQVLRVAR